MSIVVRLRLDPRRANRGPERDVHSDGFQWMSRVVLLPYGDPSASETRQDRLNPHVHHSRNTHRIVRGVLTIIFMLDATHDDPNARRMTISAGGRRRADRIIVVEPGQWYRGEPGPNGCTFVEGHEVISPATITRFFCRGDLILV